MGEPSILKVLVGPALPGRGTLFEGGKKLVLDGLTPGWFGLATCRDLERTFSGGK